MGECGKFLVHNRYTWPVVGAQMAEVYEWVLGGPKPASVECFAGGPGVASASRKPKGISTLAAGAGTGK